MIGWWFFSFLSFLTFFLLHTDCLEAVGVSAEITIPNNRMTASSSWKSAYGPHAGRLHSHSVQNSQGAVTLSGAWSARTNDKNQWLQIELNEVMTVSGVATQGRQDASQWVNSYKLEYSTDGSSWNYYPQVNTFEISFSKGIDSRFKSSHIFRLVIFSFSRRYREIVTRILLREKK